MIKVPFLTKPNARCREGNITNEEKKSFFIEQNIHSNSVSHNFFRVLLAVASDIESL